MKKNVIKQVVKFGVSSSIIGLFAGCTAVTGHKDAMNQFDVNLMSGKCEYTEIDKKNQ